MSLLGVSGDLELLQGVPLVSAFSNSKKSWDSGTHYPARRQLNRVELVPSRGHSWFQPLPGSLFGCGFFQEAGLVSSLYGSFAPLSLPCSSALFLSLQLLVPTLARKDLVDLISVGDFLKLS